MATVSNNTMMDTTTQMTPQLSEKCMSTQTCCKAACQTMVAIDLLLFLALGLTMFLLFWKDKLFCFVAKAEALGDWKEVNYTKDEDMFFERKRFKSKVEHHDDEDLVLKT